MEKATSSTYKIGEKEYECRKLVLAQYQRACGILAKLGIGKIMKVLLELQPYFAKLGSGQEVEFKHDIDVEGALAAIAEQGLLAELVALVVVPVGGRFDAAALPNLQKEVEQLELETFGEILRDFFGLNWPSIKSMFGFSGNGQTSPLQKGEKISRSKVKSSSNLPVEKPVN